MRELNERDLRTLTKGFLRTLNDLVNSDESICIESVEVFNSADLGAYGSIVVPHIVQELVHHGFIKECETRGQVRITRKGKDRLNRTIESNISVVLESLANLPRDEVGRASVPGIRLQELTELTPIEINDAVESLEEGGFVRTIKALGTNPFTFYHAEITPRGRYEYTRQSQQQASERSEVREVTEGRREISLHPTPAGSPYGFTDTHWEIVIERKNSRDRLYVVFGYKFESRYYSTETIVKNIRKMFEDAIESYLKNNPDSPKIQLIFKTLSAGYGEHIFNDIACDIISADIAVFDASDLNPNVMIEIGVALTWGVRMLPIRESRAPKLPSDISGQTWAEYSDNGAEFTSGHAERLLSMVDFAIRKKRRSW